MFNGLNKKTIIQLVVIVVAFGAAGLVLYNGFFSNNNASSSAVVSDVPFQSMSTSTSTSAQSILPYGDTLDFSKVLDSTRFQYNQIDYPQIDPQNDVGISQDSLITPAPATQQAQ
jgi:hypothetical protein